jgi:hypothetical protein
MAIVAMWPEILSGTESSGVEGTRLNTNRDGWLQAIEIRQNDEHFVSPVVRVMPTLGHARIEKVCHQTVSMTRHGNLFQHTSPVKFSKTLQLIAGKTLQKIEDKITIDGDSGTKKSTDQRRARGYSGQV